MDILNRWTNAVLWSHAGNSKKEAVEEANLSDADLSGADLSAADLSAADLSDADLSAADLSAADLSAANLRAADLRAANLRAADLSAADLRAANLRAANLRDANLSNSNCLTALGDFIRLAGTRHPIIAIDDENVSIGCMRNPLSWWRENYRDFGSQQGYTSHQIEEYRLHLEYVASWLELRKRQRAELSAIEKAT